MVTEDELSELLSDCPTLYHMAEVGSLPSIMEHGLLSTSSLLNLYQTSDPPRRAIESERRGSSVQLTREGLSAAVVRDQLPMDDRGLTRCLEDGLTPTDWYRLLNSRVFFWLTRDRLVRLLSAGTYRDQEHDVIEIDSKTLVNAYREKIWLCPINSGCTKPFPHPRGKNTFARIPDYPYADWRKKRKVGERVVELCVDEGVKDIKKYIKRAVRMKAGTEIKCL